nr:SAM-dependent methyltransferase [Paenibacillus pini]
MFNLEDRDVLGRAILDCPAGACSFTAVANAQGADVIAADIAYYFGIDELEEKGYRDIEHAMKHVEKSAALYHWSEFESVETLNQTRVQALTDCVRDMRLNPDRYIAVKLPVLPFEDEQFEMTLSAHFLFMYNDKLDYAFHVQTLQELMRVTQNEIRIFPLVDQSGVKYDRLDELRTYVDRQGWDSVELKVDYEFQRNASSMLVLKKR